MKKRTRLELIVFVVAAVIFFFQLFSERNGAIEASPKQSEAISAERLIDNEKNASIKEATGSKEEIGYETTDLKEESRSDASELNEEISSEATSSNEENAAEEIIEKGEYTAAGDVAVYLHLFGHLPSNYIRKNDAKAAGWDPDEGNLDRVCPGKIIGGDRFGNYEKKLPEKNNRKYFECDVNYDKDYGYRGQERIIFSNDGLIYYSGDHYNTFELLYGEP